MEGLRLPGNAKTPTAKALPYVCPTSCCGSSFPTVFKTRCALCNKLVLPIPKQDLKATGVCQVDGMGWAMVGDQWTCNGKPVGAEFALQRGVNIEDIEKSLPSKPVLGNEQVVSFLFLSEGTLFALDLPVGSRSSAVNPDAKQEDISDTPI